MRRGSRWAAGVAVLGVAASVLVGVTPASADSIRDREYWLNDYGISQAWNTTRGAGQTIAIIDTGVDSSVPDLAGAVGGADFSGLGSPNGQTPVGDSDENGHATMVASLAAGRGTGSDSGIIGAAPDASILSISIGFGSAAGDSDDQIAKAVRWAVDNGATVINMSLTRNTLDWPPSWDDAFLYAMQHNVVVVAAAGNRGSGTTEVGAPATMPGVVAVGGVDSNGQASFDASSQGITIAVSAPSEDLVGVQPGGGYVLWDGTSGAAPIVSGIVALVRAAYPDLDANNVIERLIATARDTGDPGTDPIYGYGLVDAAAAVTADVGPVTANPMGDLADWIRLNRRAAPTDAPTAVPSRTAAPAPVVAAAPADPFGTLLPPVNLLRTVGIPLALFLVFLVVAIWVVSRGVRGFRSSRKTG